MGLRELKKLRTRKAISDLATQLFVDRGYDNVTTAEIAELSEVSVPTLFKYFPTKESLVFDEDIEMENSLTDAVLNRKKGQTILEALLESGLKGIESIPSEHKNGYKKFMNLVEQTPALSVYAKQMWMRHEKALASVIYKESKIKTSAIEAEVIARFVLDSFHRSYGETNPKAALKAMFKIMQNGWKG